MNASLLVICCSPSWGGLEIHVRDYVLWLSRQAGVRVSLALRAGSPLHRAFSGTGWPLWLIDKTPGKLPLMQAAALAHFARMQGVTHVHAHDQRDLPLASLLRRRLDVPLAFTRHMGLAGAKKNPYHAWIYGGVDHLITVSDWMAADACRLLPLPSERIQRIWPGVSPPLAQRFERSHPEFSVGMLGRILHDKGQHLLVEAVAQLQSQGLALRVVLAGQVHDAPYWERVQARARETGVTLDYLGMVSPPARGFGQLDVAVSASQSEAFGLSTVEAMRQGLAVVAAGSGASPEILRHEVDGLIFKTGDAADLAAQIKRLRQDPALCQRLGRSAQERAAQEFDAATQFARVWATVSGLR